MKALKKLLPPNDGKLTGIDFFAAFCSAFCLSGTFSLIIFGGSEINFTALEFAKQPMFAVCFAVSLIFAFALISLFSFLIKSNLPIKVSLTVFSLAFACCLSFIQAQNSESSNSALYFIIGIAFIFFLAVCYVYTGDAPLFAHDISTPVLYTAASVIALILVLHISAAGIARYLSYKAGCFDFGIFAQLFEKMRTSFIPVTTCERNAEFSHFGVHFSPFLYLLLPFYALIPRPETLIVLQAVGVISGFLPIIFICRHLGFSKKAALACSVIYMLFPVLLRPTLTDFHENKFLSVLLLWCIYFLLKNKKALFLLFAFLTLCVKEDAAIYIFALSIYIFFTRRQRALGTFTGLLSAAYFIFSTAMVACFGGSVMIGRLGNYIPAGESGFAAVVKTCFLNFGYVLSQIFTEDKVPYIITVMLPLAFAPFFAEKKSSLILLMPMAVINLMSDWQYQYDVNYQYGYGSAVLAIFLFICAAIRFGNLKRRRILLFSVMTVTVMSCAFYFPKASYYMQYYSDEYSQEISEGYNEFISTLPKDACYTAQSKFIAHMYDFENVYMYPSYYSEQEYTEYFLADTQSVASNSNEIADFMGDKYELVKESAGISLYKLRDTVQ